MEIVKTVDLKKQYGCGTAMVKALDGVNLSIEKGSFTAVIGTSGSGKTTLLNMIGTLDRPTSGRVLVEGADLADLNDRQRAIFRRKKVGFIFQNYNLVPTLSVYENIVFALDLDNTRPDKAYLEEIAQLLSLKDRLDDFPYALSGGQQQRVAIARALAAKPAILLADEPTGNLDSKNSQNVAGLLKQCCTTFRQTLLMVTHDLELAQLADVTIRMEDGRVAE